MRCAKASEIFQRGCNAVHAIMSMCNESFHVFEDLHLNKSYTIGFWIQDNLEKLLLGVRREMVFAVLAQVSKP